MKETKTASRDVYGSMIVELAKEDRNVVTLDCDLGESTRAAKIKEVDPDRFFEMGISEQDMISTAAGMAKMGKIPFANSFAIFITGRSFDQIRQQAALPKTNVKVCGSSAGLTQGPDGATHQSVLDISLMRSLPNMTVYCPADEAQTRNVVRAAYEINGPVYIRLSRYECQSFSDDLPFESGKAQVVKNGKDVLICSTGPITTEVLDATILLEKEGIIPTIACFHTLKPFDGEKLLELAAEHKYIFTVEEHSVVGGLGTAVSESLAEGSLSGKKLARLGVKDHFGESGTATELLGKYKLDSTGLFRQMIEIIKMGK